MNSLLAFFIIVFVVIGCVGMLVSLYNRLVMLHHNVDKSFANIDVLLKQRVDELPELLKVVKASTEYEKDTLLQLTQLRTAWLASNRSEDKVRLSNELNHALKDLFAVAENYPQLKASRGFIQLQQRISVLEEQIADRREFFNESVTLYNIGINEFPALLIAKFMGYQQKPLLEITSAETQYAGLTF